LSFSTVLLDVMSSESIRARVQTARDIQLKRFSKHGSSDIICNADMRIGDLRQFCKLPGEDQSLMRAAMTQLNLSARAYHRILNLARTIADLAGVRGNPVYSSGRRAAI
jgi:magnesium chelatase family protein